MGQRIGSIAANQSRIAGRMSMGSWQATTGGGMVVAATCGPGPGFFQILDRQANLA